MTIIAFAGPSLPPADRDQYPGIEWRSPAEAGDLLRIEPMPSLTLCLIDGYFDHRPAVRHKEILLLLSEGVRIFGASSIGALRAAEMSAFGMTGIGAIYRAYADGRLEGDDEVALIHAGPEWGWRPLSVPLVDLRATLCRAVHERALEPEEARRLRVAAAEIHYVDRTWDLALEAARMPATHGFRAWLPRGGVALKLQDAKSCLRSALMEPASQHERPTAVSTVFLRALAADLDLSLEGRL